MNQENELIYKCIKRARNNYLLGFLIILLVGGGMFVGGLLSKDYSGTTIAVIILGLLFTLLGVFGFIKVVKPILNPLKAPVANLLFHHGDQVTRFYLENITSGAYGISRTVQQVHILDQNNHDYVLGVKKKQLEELLDLLKKLAPKAEVGYDPESMKKEKKATDTEKK